MRSLKMNNFFDKIKIRNLKERNFTGSKKNGMHLKKDHIQGDYSPVSRINTISPGKCPELDNSSYHVNIIIFDYVLYARLCVHD